MLFEHEPEDSTANKICTFVITTALYAIGGLVVMHLVLSAISGLWNLLLT
jgi:hypothetical protein